MKKVKRFVSIILLLCACILSSVPAAFADEGGEPGNIDCGVTQLFTDENYNHYHFQKDCVMCNPTVYVNCTEYDDPDEGSFEVRLDSANVYEWFPEGEVGLCSAYSVDGMVKYSATFESDADIAEKLLEYAKKAMNVYKLNK